MKDQFSITIEELSEILEKISLRYQNLYETISFLENNIKNLKKSEEEIKKQGEELRTLAYIISHYEEEKEKIKKECLKRGLLKSIVSTFILGLGGLITKFPLYYLTIFFFLGSNIKYEKDKYNSNKEKLDKTISSITLEEIENQKQQLVDNKAQIKREITSQKKKLERDNKTKESLEVLIDEINIMIFYLSSKIDENKSMDELNQAFEQEIKENEELRLSLERIKKEGETNG